jgi:hypothetical protein
MWIGLFAAPVAFAFEHLSGWLISEGDCDTPGRQSGIAFTTWVGVVTAIAAALAAGGLVAAVLAYRAVEGTDNDAPPPTGRIWLLSLCGIVVSGLLFLLIVLGGSGALLLGHCQDA